MELPVGDDHSQTRGGARGWLHRRDKTSPRDALLRACSRRGAFGGLSRLVCCTDESSSRVDVVCTIQLATRAGVPPGVINIVTTQANVSEVGREMCENPIVKKISFTGSTPVAKILYGMASSTLKKYDPTLSLVRVC